MRGQKLANQPALWLFTNKISENSLGTSFQSDVPFVLSPIQRTYGWTNGPEAANGVMLEVKPAGAFTRLVTGIRLNAEGTTEQTITRQVFTDTMRINVNHDHSELIWIIPNQYSKDQSMPLPASGQASCIVRTPEVTGYCIIHGKGLSWEKNSLVTVNDPVSLVVDFGNQKISYSSPSPQSIELYWPFHVNSIVNAGGQTISFAQQGDRIIVTLPSGDGAMVLK